MPLELAQLDADKLQQTVYDRLHGADVGGPPLDGGDVFEWFVQEYRFGRDEFQSRLVHILGRFLDELGDADRWPDPAANNLLDLIQDIGERLESQLFELVRTGRLFGHDARGKRLHAGLLKCLISIGHKATPDFWMQQFERLGPEYGALIMSGLSDHGLGEAMPALPLLVQHETAREAVRLLWRHLVDQYGLMEVSAALDAIREQLGADIYALYRDDLVRLGLPPRPSPCADPVALPNSILSVLSAARDFEVESPCKLELFPA